MNHVNLTKKFFKNHRILKFVDTTENGLTYLNKTLDTKKSIDGYMLDEFGSLETFAIRHQFGKSYKTFTTRYRIRSGSFDTEYEKIKNNIKNNLSYPIYTIQCYWDNSRGANLLDYKVVKTKLLFDYYSDNFYSCEKKTAPCGNEFIFCKWSDLENHKQLSLF